MEARPHRQAVWKPTWLSRLDRLIRGVLKRITLGWSLVAVFAVPVLFYICRELAHHTLLANLKQVKPTSWAIAAFGLPLLRYVYLEVTHVALIIDPFSVPKRFEEAGLTSEVIANRIGDALRQIETMTQTRMKKDDLSLLRDEAAMPDVEIPGTKIGLKTIVEITRAVFGKHPKHLVGDIVISATAETEVTVTFCIAKGRERSAPVSFAGCASNIGLLAKRTAELALEQVNPYVLAAYRKDRGEFSEAIEIAQRMAEDPSVDVEHRTAAFNLWGLVLYGQKKYEDAIAKCKKAIELDPGYPHAYNNWGLMLAMQKKYDEAVEKYRRAIELDPKYAIAYNNWGLVLYRRHKTDEAGAYYAKAIELDPKYAISYNNLGNVFFDQKKYEDAVIRYQMAIGLDPKFAFPLNNWGNVLRDQGKYDEAIAKYQKAIELDPKYALAHYNWGFALYNQTRRDEAVVMYQKAITLDPEYPDAYNNLGIAFLDQKKYDEAVANFQKAIELNPEYAFAYNNWGNVLREQGDYEGAIAKYQQAIQLDPKYAKPHNNWGIALQAQGKSVEANEKFTRARELSSANDGPRQLVRNGQ
jgi:tetratricopeptide (TPR) repeat protein